MRKVVKYALITGSMLALCAAMGTAGSKKPGKRTWMGVYTQTVDSDLAEAYDLTVDYGVIVDEVIRRSPADKAGIEEDDIIISFNGDQIRSHAQLIGLVRDRDPGDEVVVTVNRHGDSFDFTVILGDRIKSQRRHGSYVGPMDLSDYYYYGRDKRGYIGVILLDLGDQLGEYFGVPEGDGALIKEVGEDSPAAKAGLKAGDVIIRVGEDEISDVGDVQESIRDRDPGDEVKITLVRNKREVGIAVTIGESDIDDLPWSMVTPDVPWVDLHLPQMKGLLNGRSDDHDLYFDADEIEGEMEDLRDELRKLKRELRKLQISEP